MKTTRPEPGERHGRLVYVGGDERRQVSCFGDRPVFASFGKWRCDCGTERTYRNSRVVNGCIKSCGCLRKATGEEWKKGKRVRRQPLQRLVPQYLVELRGMEGSELLLYEVFDPVKELSVWDSRDGIDVWYDHSCLARAYRRANDRAWVELDVPSLAGILKRTPGVRVWRGDEPPARDDAEGWEVVQ